MRQPMTDSEWLAEKLKQEARWQAFINEYRARCEALIVNCPACSGRGYLSMYDDYDKLCPWCNGARTGTEVRGAR